jgi:hypothetical protein
MSIKIDSLDVMKAEMDIQERTRMLDTYNEIEEIVDRITKLSVFPSLVWVWAWDVTRDLYTSIQEGAEEEYCVAEDIEDVWQMFWEDADKNGFTLEYGAETLYEHVRDWMIDRHIIDEVPEDDEEEEVDEDE